MLLGLDGLNYKRKIAMTEPTKEQAWKEEARKTYQDQQTQDNEGGCREPTGFVQGYLAAKKSSYSEMMELEELQKEADEINKESIQWRDEAIENLNQEIKTLKEQLAAEIKQREKAENILKVSADINLSGWETYRMANQYFAEKEKQDKQGEG